jgi:hypothetical protein
MLCDEFLSMTFFIDAAASTFLLLGLALGSMILVPSLPFFALLATSIICITLSLFFAWRFVNPKDFHSCPASDKINDKFNDPKGQEEVLP